MEKRENHQWEGKPKPREIPEKSDNESSGVRFICGFECPTCCTATAPSARTMQEVSGRCGSCHGRDLSLTESCTEEEWVTRLLSCCAEVFNVRKQNFRDKVLFLF